jgi:hypothetical protein
MDLQRRQILSGVVFELLYCFDQLSKVDDERFELVVKSWGKHDAEDQCRQYMEARRSCSSEWRLNLQGHCLALSDHSSLVYIHFK